MNALDGIEELHMSGARAVFKTKGGSPPDETALAGAFEEQGMELMRLDRIERPRAKAVYVVDAGVT